MPAPRPPPSPSAALSPPLSPLLIGAEEATVAAAAALAVQAGSAAVLEEAAPQQQSASQLLDEMDDEMQLGEPVAIHSLPPSPAAAALPTPLASSTIAAPQPSSFDAAISVALQPSSDALAENEALPPAPAPVQLLHASAAASDALHPPARTRTQNPSLARHSELPALSTSLPVATQSQQHQLLAAHQPLRISSSILAAVHSVGGAAGAAFRARLSLPPPSIVHHSAPSSADIPPSRSPSMAAAPLAASLCPPLSSSLGAALGSSNNSSSSLPPMSLCESPLPSIPAGCDAADSIMPSQQLLHPPAPSQMPPPSPSLHPSHTHLPSIEDGSIEPQLHAAEDNSPRSPSPSRMGGSPIPTHPPEMDSFEPEQEVDPEGGLHDHADADERRGAPEAEVTPPKRQQQEQRQPLKDLASLQQPSPEHPPQSLRPCLVAAAALVDPLGATMEEDLALDVGCAPASIAALSLPPLTLHLSLPSDSSNDVLPTATLPSEMEDVRTSGAAIAERDDATSAEAPTELPAEDALTGSALPNTFAIAEKPLQPLALEQPQLPVITAATTPSLYMTEPMQLDEGVAPVATAPSVSLQPASQSDEQPPSPTFDFTPAALPDSASSLLPTLTLPAAVRAPPRSILSSSSSRRRLPAFCAANKRRVRFNLTEAEAAAHEDEPSNHAAPRKTVARMPKKKSAAAAMTPAASEISQEATTSTDAQWRIPPSFDLDLSCTLSASSPPLDGHSSTTIAAAAAAAAAAAIASVGSSGVLAAPSLIDLSHSLDGWNTGVGGGGEEDGAASQLFDEPFLEPFMLLEDKPIVAAVEAVKTDGPDTSNSSAASSKQECKPTLSTLKQDTDTAAAAVADSSHRSNDVEAVPFASASLQMSASEVQHNASLITAPATDAARMQLKTEAVAAAAAAAPAINAAAEARVTLKTKRVALKQEAMQRILCDSDRTAVKRERTVQLSTENTISNAFVPPIPAAAAAAAHPKNSASILPRKRPLSPDPSDVAESGRGDDGADAAAAQWLEDDASEAAAPGATAALDVEAEADLPSDDECMPFAPPVGSPLKSNKTAGAPTKVSQPVAAKASSKRALPVPLAPAAVSPSAFSAMAGPKAKRARTADKTATGNAVAPAVKVDRVRLKQENGASSSKPKDHSSGKVQASLSSFFTLKPTTTVFGLAGDSHILPSPRSATSPAGSFVSSRRTYASAPSEATIASTAAAAADPSLARKDGHSSAVVERKKIASAALAARERIDLVDDDENNDSDTYLAPKPVGGRASEGAPAPAVAKSSTQAVKARKPRRKLTSAPTSTNKTSKSISAPSDKAAAPVHFASFTPMSLPVAAAPAVAASLSVPAAAGDGMMLDLGEDEQGSQIFHYA